MNIKVLVSAVAMAVASAPAFAQDATPEAAVTPEAAATTATGTTTTGFVPVASAALGAAGPLAIGLGAIIAIGAISGGGGSSSSTNGTN